MIRERQVKGPLNSVEFNGKQYRLDYRRRYYEKATHFTWIEVELSPGNWGECKDAIQTGTGGIRLTKNIVRTLVREFLMVELIENVGNVGYWRFLARELAPAENRGDN